MWICRYESTSWRTPEIDTNAEIPLSRHFTASTASPTRVGPSWHGRAACVGLDDELFFGAENFSEQHLPSAVKQLNLARLLCDECPVIKECLTHALTIPEHYGIWAGTSGNMREKMLKRVREGISTMSQVIQDYLDTI